MTVTLQLANQIRRLGSLASGFNVNYPVGLRHCPFRTPGLT